MVEAFDRADQLALDRAGLVDLGALGRNAEWLLGVEHVIADLAAEPVGSHHHAQFGDPVLRSENGSAIGAEFERDCLRLEFLGDTLRCSGIEIGVEIGLRAVAARQRQRAETDEQGGGDGGHQREALAANVRGEGRKEIQQRSPCRGPNLAPCSL